TLSDSCSHALTPGLVVTAGSLTSLDMTVNANFRVAAVTVSATDLEFRYTASNQVFSLSGTASVAVLGMGSLSVTFGHGSMPGLRSAERRVGSQDMTV